jgi:hypothetical protein
MGCTPSIILHWQISAVATPTGSPITTGSTFQIAKEHRRKKDQRHYSTWALAFYNLYARKKPVFGLFHAVWRRGKCLPFVGLRVGNPIPNA